MMKTDVFIAGSGCSGLFCALKLPKDKNIILISKSDFESNDSYLAQGGICMLKSESDYDDFFEDTLRAGHYENDRKSVEIMIKSSKMLIEELLKIGVDFEREDDGSLAFTKEGAHSTERILFHEDITGKEITSKLLEEAKKRANIKMLEYTTMLDIVQENGRCKGAVIRLADGSIETVDASFVVMACGGIGGLYKHSTNYKHLTGDAIAIALKNNIECRDLDYVQIHPTTLYSEEDERSFLISESVRGEGAHLYNKDMQRFADELMPRDKLTEAIRLQMEADGTDYVWEDMRLIPSYEIKNHFPNIADYCMKKGYDVTKQCIPVVPAQHYFMGGIKVDHYSRTSMQGLYAVGETACNGVHGKNRLASNSLLESMVFAGRAAEDIGKAKVYNKLEDHKIQIDYKYYENVEKLQKEYKKLVLNKIDEMASERGVANV